MDYVLGSVAALISGGNVTPNRPRTLKRALTPTKHQPSPNVTPKSEFVDDRSIFLSPTLQKKKAIVKKSPKRIFQNPDLDVTNDGEGSNLTSPKVEKVKKHLKEDLEADEPANTNTKSTDKKSPKKKKPDNATVNLQVTNESTPKKKKRDSVIENVSAKHGGNLVSNEQSIVSIMINNSDVSSPKKNKKRKHKSTENVNDNEDNIEMEIINKKTNSPKKKHISEIDNENSIEASNENQIQRLDIQNEKSAKKKNKKKKFKMNTNPAEHQPDHNLDMKSPKKKKNKNKVNPNAITDKDSDSEHDSDNVIDSETEQTNNKILDTGPLDSSDEEEGENIPKQVEQTEKTIDTEEEIKRTLFVGNVPFSNKCKKEIKKIFNKYGQIQTIRIRTVPVKDARVTPKLAVIKNELHPDRSTVNVYIKFMDPSSVNEALVENNTIYNGCHLRVTRSDSAGYLHDPKCSVFVGNLPFAVEDEALRAKFERCGEVHSVRVIRDQKTNAGKGFGYVNFTSKDAVELALALSDEDLTMKNRILRVKRCMQTNKEKNARTNNQGFRVNPRFRTNQGHQKNQGQQWNQGQQRNQSYQRNLGNQRNQGNQGHQSYQGPQRAPGYKRNQAYQGKGPIQRNGNQNRRQEQIEDGAYRRIMNKRQNQDTSNDGPPTKIQKTVGPKEKKSRKEFVGMTADKKKKQKSKKGQKKKKSLSEILTK